MIYQQITIIGRAAEKYIAEYENVSKSYPLQIEEHEVQE